MKEEDIIREKCGAANPFKVPDGYFDGLTRNIMAKLPEQEAREVVMVPRRSSWRIVAAVCCAASVSLLIFLGVRQYGGIDKNTQIAQQTELKSSDEEYVDEVLDYAMIDDHEIYSYLSSVN